jgi:hypothetical protein
VDLKHAATCGGSAPLHLPRRERRRQHWQTALREMAAAARWAAHRAVAGKTATGSQQTDEAARESPSPSLPYLREERRAARRPDPVTAGSGVAGAWRSGRRRPLAHAAMRGRESASGPVLRFFVNPADFCIREKDSFLSSSPSILVLAFRMTQM